MERDRQLMESENEQLSKSPVKAQARWTPLLVWSTLGSTIGTALPCGYCMGVINSPAVVSVATICTDFLAHILLLVARARVVRRDAAPELQLDDFAIRTRHSLGPHRGYLSGRRCAWLRLRWLGSKSLR